MTKTGTKLAATLCAIVMALAFMPLIGAQKAFAAADIVEGEDFVFTLDENHKEVNFKFTNESGATRHRVTVECLEAPDEDTYGELVVYRVAESGPIYCRVEQSDTLYSTETSFLRQDEFANSDDEDEFTKDATFSFELHDYSLMDDDYYAVKPGARMTIRVLVEPLYSLSDAVVTLAKTQVAYTGAQQKPAVKSVKLNGKTLRPGTDYAVYYYANTLPGDGVVEIEGMGDYYNSGWAHFTIGKVANPLAAKGKTAKVKYSKVKKKAQTLAVSKVINFTKKGQGTMTYTKASGNKKITINKSTGKVTVKKGLKKGTYKVKVKVKAAGNAIYNASAAKTVTFKVKVA